MTKDINNFITIVRQKNGRVKITHDIQNEANIYKLLHELGYCKSKLDNKRIYFRRDKANVIPLHLWDIKNAFLVMLKNLEFINIPDDIEYEDILNWYYRQDPIKDNGLFNHYLSDNLTEPEIHSFRLQTDCIYKHKFEIQQMLLKLEEWKFDKTVDISSSICKNAPLYYKKIETNKFLIFSYFNSKVNTNDGFDCWVATFSNVKHIGIKEPLKLQDIRLSFQLDRDFQLIKDYLIK